MEQTYVTDFEALADLVGKTVEVSFAYGRDGAGARFYTIEEAVKIGIGHERELNIRYRGRLGVVYYALGTEPCYQLTHPGAFENGAWNDLFRIEDYQIKNQEKLIASRLIVLPEED